jgi:hypothetical protein
VTMRVPFHLEEGRIQTLGRIRARAEIPEKSI